MNELIKIEERDGIETVNARELHEFLESGRQFGNWITQRIESYGFVEGVDFTINKFVIGKATQKDYYISIDMAKELSMVENNEKGKEARQYFIAVEKKAKALMLPNFNNPAEAARAWANEYEQKQIAQHKVKELEPKAEFYDAVTESKDTIDIGTASKVLNYDGIGRNKLFEILRSAKVLDRSNIPYQRFVDAEYFRCIETKFTKPDGTTSINIKTVVYQKGLDYIRQILDKFIEKKKKKQFYP